MSADATLTDVHATSLITIGSQNFLRVPASKGTNLRSQLGRCSELPVNSPGTKGGIRSTRYIPHCLGKGEGVAAIRSGNC